MYIREGSGGAKRGHRSLQRWPTTMSSGRLEIDVPHQQEPQADADAGQVEEAPPRVSMYLMSATQTWSGRPATKLLLTG
jgi:hypothetical protein